MSGCIARLRLPLIALIIIVKVTAGSVADSHRPEGSSDGQGVGVTEPMVTTDDDNIKEIKPETKRYLLYDQSLAEGFNLRRDVYIRMALLCHRLGPHWTLVLPEWSSVPHWVDTSRDTSHGFRGDIPAEDDNDEYDDPELRRWSAYFDVQSLGHFVPVVEYHEFLDQMSSTAGNPHTETVAPVDVVLSLDHFPDTFANTDDNEWRERHALEDCSQSKYYRRLEGDTTGGGSQVVVSLLDDRSDGRQRRRRVRYRRLLCLRIDGFVRTLASIIGHHFPGERAVLVSNAEVILNDEFGGREYWRARRSMHFAQGLVSVANAYRWRHFAADDTTDRTQIDTDWRQMQRTHGQALGGPYMAVHLRRGDFARYRGHNVPDVDCMAEQVGRALRQYMPTDGQRVFIASDATEEEWLEIEEVLAELQVKHYRLDHGLYAGALSAGQLAVVEQLVAIHSRLFVGTYDSTFSFRIQEEREILGFRHNTTFNALCAKCPPNAGPARRPFPTATELCKQESQWKIVY